MNGTYASLLDLPYLSDYKVNPTLDKLVTDLGGLNNFNNNALGSFVDGPAVPGRREQGGGQRPDAGPRSRCSPRSTDEHSFTADGIVGPTDVGGRVPSTCSVLVQLQNGVWNRVDPTTPGTFDCNAANIATIKMTVS